MLATPLKKKLLNAHLMHLVAGILLVLTLGFFNLGSAGAQNAQPFFAWNQQQLAGPGTQKARKKYHRTKKKYRRKKANSRYKKYRKRKKYTKRQIKRWRRKQALKRRNKWKRKKVAKPSVPAWHKATPKSKDPIQIIVSLPEQRVTVYRGTEPVVTSRVSSGKQGHTSPSGIFSILQKNKHHRSNIYSNAPMPFMQRLTWSGIALHASKSVPNYPASHGCIRLPHSFAGQLFKYTGMGGHVIVANEKVAPTLIEHANLFQPAGSAPKVVATAETGLRLSTTDVSPVVEAKPSHEDAPLRILITRPDSRQQLFKVQELLNEISFNAGDVDGYLGPDTISAIRRFQSTYSLKTTGLMNDAFLEKLYELTGNGKPGNGHMYVRQNFSPVYDAPVTIRGGEKSLGSHLFTAMHFEADATTARWLSVTLTKGSPKYSKWNRATTSKKNKWSPKKKKKWAVKKAPVVAPTVISSTALEALGRIEMTPAVRQHMNKILTPGSSIAITNDGISRETSPVRGSDFVTLMQ